MPAAKNTNPSTSCDRFETCPHESAIIELRASVHAMREDQVEMKGDLKLVREAIAGDIRGEQPGFADRIRTHERRIGELEDTEKTRRAWAKAAIGAAATTWIGLAATWMWSKFGGH